MDAPLSKRLRNPAATFEAKTTPLARNPFLRRAGIRRRDTVGYGYLSSYYHLSYL